MARTNLMSDHCPSVRLCSMREHGDIADAVQPITNHSCGTIKRNRGILVGKYHVSYVYT